MNLSLLTEAEQMEGGQKLPSIPLISVLLSGAQDTFS
jgi:hypothetical protein